MEKFVLVVGILHVDKINQDDAGKVPKAKLSGNFCCCLEVDFAVGLFCFFLTGVFATQFISGEGGVKGALYGDWHQLWIQIIATVISIVFSAVMTYILFKITDRLVGIRVDKRVEEEGLDIYEHGESAYSH